MGSPFSQITGVAANYMRAVQRMWGLSEAQLAVMPPEILTMFPFDPRAWPDLFAPANIRIALGGVAQSGGVGTQAKILLRNPLDSAALIILTWWSVCPVTTDDIEIRLGTGTVGTLQNVTQFADSRFGLGGTRIPVGQIRSTTDAASEGITIGTVRGVSNEMVNLGPVPPIVLGPDSWLMFRMATANQNMRANFGWIERAAQPAELAV